MAHPAWHAIVVVLAASLFPTTFARADFALCDGDTVVFLGDSITAARTYGKIIENYTLLRFPGRKVRFINAGWGGDTAAGGLKRLETDVFGRGATVLIVAYGINDIGWGLKADAEHKQLYLDSIRGIVERCRARKVRVFICSAAITAEDPAKSEHGFLQDMCDEGLALARSLGAGTIDLERTMRAIQRNVYDANAHAKSDKEKQTLHAADGIHLNDVGQLAMAFGILKGLGAPAEVSAVTIDVHGPRLLAAAGCQVTNLSGDAATLQFDRLDEGLPLNLGVFGALKFRFVPVPDELNRYMLTVKNLPEGRYELRADDRALGTFTAKQLAAGINIASSTADPWQPGGPWDGQAALLIRLTDARSELALAQQFTGIYLPEHPARKPVQTQAEAVMSEIEAIQRVLVRPATYHFVVRPAAQEPQ